MGFLAVRAIEEPDSGVPKTVALFFGGAPDAIHLFEAGHTPLGLDGALDDGTRLLGPECRGGGKQDQADKNAAHGMLLEETV
jgi:hypothetical protein